MGDNFSGYDVFNHLGKNIDLNKYAPCHCGADCARLNADENQPCWGEVGPLGISGDDDFGHYCEGHAPLYYGEKYKEKPG